VGVVLAQAVKASRARNARTIMGLMEHLLILYILEGGKR